MYFLVAVQLSGFQVFTVGIEVHRLPVAKELVYEPHLSLYLLMQPSRLPGCVGRGTTTRTRVSTSSRMGCSCLAGCCCTCGLVQMAAMFLYVLLRLSTLRNEAPAALKLSYWKHGLVSNDCTNSIALQALHEPVLQ